MRKAKHLPQVALKIKAMMGEVLNTKQSITNSEPLNSDEYQWLKEYVPNHLSRGTLKSP
jgi:hypothetical protein